MRIPRTIAALLCVVALAGNASADPPDARAKSRALFLQGVAALDDAHPREALASFERAYELFPHYATHYNIALCHRALGQSAEAANALQRYLDEGGTAAPSEENARVTALLTELDSKLAIVTVTANLGATGRMTIDGRSSRVGIPIRVEPGEHVVEAASGGSPAAKTKVSVRAGERRAVAIQLATERAEPSMATPQPQSSSLPPALLDPSASPPPTRLNTTFWVATGTSAAALAVFAVAGVLASSAQTSYANAPTDADASYEKSRGQRLAVVADVGLVISLVAATVAVIVAVRPIDDPSRVSTSTPTRSSGSR